MKKTFLFILLVMAYLSMKAQDPQLLPNDWYLEKMIIDGEDLPLPDNNEITFVLIEFLNESFGTSLCDLIEFSVINYSSDTIEVNEFAFLSLDLCDLQENIDYSIIYLGFFGAPAPGNPSIIEYEIIAVNDYLQLILTNEDGDQAIYNNTLLNTISFEIQDIAIYPNPATETLFVETNASIEQWSVYNLQGQMVLEGEKGVTSIEVSSLTQGVYFIELLSGSKKLIKKFVKR